MSCGAKPSVQIFGTRGQGLGSHLCGRISVTRCPIPDHYTTVRRLVPERGPMRRIRFTGDRSQPEVPSGEWWSDGKRASSTARLQRTCLRSPGLALKRLNVATTKGASLGETGVGLVYDGVGSLASTQVGNFFGVPTVVYVKHLIPRQKEIPEEEIEVACAGSLQDQEQAADPARCATIAN